MPLFEHEGVDIFYEVAGEGPPLFLINGLSLDTRGWGPLVDALKASFRIVSYDMRCAGRSDKPDAPFSIDDLAEEAHGLMRHLRLDGAGVLGFSMGGMVAMRLALAHPEAVRRLVLVSTAPSLARPHPPSEGIVRMLHRTDVSPALLTEVYESIFGSAYRQRVSAGDFISARMDDDSPQPARAYLRQIAALESCDLGDEVGAISVPAAVVAGDEDRILPPENARWLARRLPNATLHVFKGVGHMVPLEAPRQLAEAAFAD